MNWLDLKPLQTPFNAQAVKETLLQGRELLRQRYARDRNGSALLRNHSRLVDGILRHVWRETGMPESVTLVAVGGYGRQQLFPHSDIDLLVLLSTERSGATAMDAAAEARLEQWVRLLWDTGLEVGHSVRTIAECTAEALKDITVQTCLLEARQLAGCRQLFQEFSSVMQGMLEPRAFFTDKQLEQRDRH